MRKIFEEFDLKPDFNAISNRFGQSFFDDFANRVGMLAGAEMRDDDDLVFEPVGPSDDVFQVRMAEFVGVFRPFELGDESHLAD